MSIAPRVIAAVLVIGASLWSLAVTTTADEPFAADSGLMVSLGLVGFALVAAVGLLLPRGRWARNLARVLLACQAGLAAVMPLRPMTILALVATAAGIVAVQGRWLDGWLRRLPAADGPGLLPMLFLLGCLAVAPTIGVASPSGLDIRHGVFAAVAIIIGWGYSRAQLWALWAGRFALAPTAVLAAFASPPGGAALLFTAGAGLGWLAWSQATRLAIDPLLDHLSGPRRLQPREGTGE